MTPADHFLDGTDAAYQECATGIADLDRIIVASPTALAGRTRTALVPALYAYWERFFRVTMGEFLRAVSTARLPLAGANKSLAKHRIKGEIRERLGSRVYETMMRAAEKEVEVGVSAEASTLSAAANALLAFCADPLSFADPELYVTTEANVRYEVVEKNCLAFGVDVDDLRAELEACGYKIYPDLKDLVDTRNKVAHGESILETAQPSWEKLRSFTLSLMNALQMTLLRVLETDGYRSQP